jgi:hypothetical protein
MRFLVFCGWFALLGAALGQDDPLKRLEAAPPAIDNALRERVNHFYQAFLEAKFRRADEVVHEDSKDFFFSSQKRQYKAFSITSITYRNNFQEAEVMTLVDADMPTPMAGPMAMKLPMTTQWKMDQGKWWWYVRAQETFSTPFGQYKRDPNAPATMKPPTEAERINPFAQVAQMKVEPSPIALNPGNSWKAVARLANTVAGPIELELEMPADAAGLSARLSKPDLNRGEATEIALEYKLAPGEPDRSLTFHVVVKPIGRKIPVKVDVRGRS